MSNVLDTFSTLLESVSGHEPALLAEGSTTLYQAFNVSKKEKISRRLFRIPVQLYRGGAVAKFSPSAGATVGMGLAHHGTYTHMTSGYFYTKLAFQISAETVEVAESGLSTVNLYAREVATILDSYKAQMDCVLHTDGTGKLTDSCSAATAAATSTMTFATGTQGVSLIIPGMVVDVWNSAGSTKRGSAVVTSVNQSTKVVSLAANISGLTAGDILAVSGMDAYGPSALTSFSSAWPTPPASQVAAGLSGDSYIHGLAYYADTNGSNYVLGLQKSSIPELIPATYAAGGNPLSWSHAMRLWTQYQTRRLSAGERSTDGMIGLMNMTQRESLMAETVAVNNLKQIESGGVGDVIDFLPKNFEYGDPFNYGGVMCFPDKRMRTDLVWFVRPDLFIKTYSRDFGIWDEDGRKIRPVIGSDGTPTNELVMYWTESCDFATTDPGRCIASITGLAVPA